MAVISRRTFIKSLAMGSVAVGFPVLNACTGARPTAPAEAASLPGQPVPKTDIVSVVRIKNGNVDAAVRQAIDLIGGMGHITAGKERILIKPNLVSHEPRDVTKPEVVKALARVMIESGKAVVIGEGSAVGKSNLRPGIMGGACRTRDVAQLNEIQRFVFDALGYKALAKDLKIPLVNLHTGELVRVPVPGAFVYPEIALHPSLIDTDLVCSVPMMKTHGLAGVTLGMKNFFGAFPGQEYGTVRSAVHTAAAKVEPSGTASAIVDMVRAVKPGLVVIDGSMAMQGQGPSVHQGGRLLETNLIIAGTNPLATDMVAAALMGFAPREISTFSWAWKAGLLPTGLTAIDVRGESIDAMRRPFKRPVVIPYRAIPNYGPPC